MPQPPIGPESLRAFGDAPATRKAIYDSVFQAASTLPDVSNQTHTLRLSGVQWADPDRFSKKQHKEAVLTGNTLGRRLQGTWELLENATGKVLDHRQQVILRAPHLTDSGTFVHNGSDYTLKHQQRLKSGIYTRTQENGDVESHVNVLAGGPAHRYQLDPVKGIFYARLGQANIPLLPLLQHLGANDKEMREAWGDDLFARNYSKADASATGKLVEKVLRGKLPEGMSAGQALKAAFEKMTLDPDVTRRTLGQPYARLDKDAVLAATKKLLAVSRHESEPDDRDHLAYQKFMGPEDMMSERLTKDRAGVRRQLLYKMTGKGHLQTMPSSALQRQIDSALMESGLGQAVEEIGPLELLDKNTQISRMGEGGIAGSNSVPSEARSVQPSQFGFIDPLRTPESFAAGVDVFLAGNSRKGPDGSIYGQFKDPRTGQLVWKSPRDLSDKVVAFPGAMNLPTKRIPVIKDGRMTWAKKSQVSYVLPDFERAFSPLGNLVPFKSMVKGQRTAMGSRMSSQALPLENPEAPLVQSGMPGTNGTRSYEEEYGRHAGAIHADQGGQVLAVTPDAMKVKYADGTMAEIELDNNRAYNRKTFSHQTPMIQPGQRFAPGQLLAKSNFTDDKGTVAVGKNLRTAYSAWGGQNFEDAIVISDSAAKKLSSVHAYQHQMEVGERTKTGKNAYISLFPSKYDKATLAKLGPDGVIKPGTPVVYGDPLIVGAEERSDSLNKIHKKGQASHNDVSVTWDHKDPGVVTDVTAGRDGPVVVVKSVHPMQEADKLANRFGGKGIVKILPDGHMPTDATGAPYEVLLNPLGIVSRGNPAQIIETALGKIAAKTGIPFKMEDFSGDTNDWVDKVQVLLKQHGLSDTEDIIDPRTQRKIPGVMTGSQFFMKLHHTSEGKSQGRSGGAYTSLDEPAKGGEQGSKRLSMLDVNALLSSGATEVIRDAGAIRGQRNEDYWLQFMQGHTPREPKVPMVYEKYISDLKASGINVVKDGAQTHIMAMTDKDVDRLAGDRNIEHGDTVEFDGDLKEIPGGLFDKGKTGGHHGGNWSAIQFVEPMLNPVMEDPARRLLGLTQKKFEEVLAGREPLTNGQTGPAGIASALKSINVDRDILLARAKIKSGSQSARDDAVRRLGYLKSAKRLGVHPGDWVLKRAPVLPPQFRPINIMSNKNVPLIADSNFLYRELIEANSNLAAMKQATGEDVGEERLAVYNAFKAVTGLGEPITQKSQEKKVKGILAGIFGSSPKHSTIQRKLISSTVDNVGRAVISPDPDLDMDSAGLPEDRAFDIYQRFVVRRLKRAGMPITQALREVKDKTPLARQTLMAEMENRPVIIDRAPVLHRFGIMAFRPHLTKGSSLKMSPLITKGYNADFDGDAVQYNVPVSEEARLEALDRMLPSKQLFSVADFKTPMHMPTQEYAGGLWSATAPEAQSKRPTRYFKSVKDLRHAWEAGEIAINDPAMIVGK